MHLPLMVIILSVASQAEQPTIVVRGSTSVAFFPLTSQKELEADPDTNETLADFQFYAAQVREPFHKAGIDFQVVYAAAFQIRFGAKLTTFRPGPVKVGYYFIAPGKRPRVEYGVETDIGLRRIASDYFGITLK